MSSPTPPIQALPVNAAAPERAPAPPRWLSSQLLDGGREALIQHQGAEYRLRLTASGKLILTK